MHDLSIAKCVVGVFCAASLASCTLLIGTSERQCKSNADCVSAKLGTLCVDQVCIDGNNCQGQPGCTSESVLPSSGKCTDDRDCTNNNAPRCFNGSCESRELAERWICQAEDTMIRSATVRYSFRIVDFLSGIPPKNIVVKACRNNDVGCETPVSTFTDMEGTGHAQFELTAGFLGFFDIRSDSMPTLLYVTKPIYKNTLNRDLPVLSAGTVQLTAAYAGVKFDSAKGLALLEAIDCSETPAGGISFKVNDSNANQFYLVDQAPSLEATVTMYDEKTNSANGGFINVQPGFVTFSAFLGVDGLKLGSFNAQVRANTVTFIDMDF